MVVSDMLRQTLISSTDSDFRQLANALLNIFPVFHHLSPHFHNLHHAMVLSYKWRYSNFLTRCWYVSVKAEGYRTEISPMVGVPPEVTDLDIQLQPEDAAIYLPVLQ